jgi:hypothetical protein
MTQRLKPGSKLAHCDTTEVVPVTVPEFRAYALTAVGAGFGVDAFLRQPQALDGLAANQMLLHNLRGVRRLYMAVPDRIRINDDRGSMFALVKAAGFVDAHRGAEAGGFRELLQLGEELALSVCGAGRAGSVGRADVVTDEDMTFK